MDVVSSAAAVLQLLGQAVFLVQQGYLAHEAVKTAPKQLSDTKAQLINLVQTIEEIWREPDLHTRAIHEQLLVIYEIAEELTRILEAMKKLQVRGKMYQGIYMLMKKARDEGRLNEVLGRLANAKDELGIRINVVHVGLTRGVRMGVERIEKGMGEERGQQRRESSKGGRWHFHDLRVDGNTVEEDGRQMNGIVGFEGEKVPSARASVAGNRAVGRAQQQNFILGSGGAAELWALKSGA